MYESASKTMYVWPRFSSTQRQYAYAGSISVNGAITTGVMAMADAECYLDGVSSGTITQAWSGGAATIPIYIGALNFSSRFYFRGSIQAIVIYNTVLSAAQVAAISAAMAAL